METNYLYNETDPDRETNNQSQVNNLEKQKQVSECIYDLGKQDVKKYNLEFLYELRNNCTKLSAELKKRLIDLKLSRSSSADTIPSYVMNTFNELHLNFLMDEQLQHRVEYHNQLRQDLENENAGQKQPNKKWQNSESTWVMLESDFVEKKSSDYLTEVLKKNSVPNSLKAIAAQMVKVDVLERNQKKEKLQKEILAKIPVVNARIEELKKNHKLRKHLVQNAIPGSSRDNQVDAKASRLSSHFGEASEPTKSKNRNESISSTSTANSSLYTLGKNKTSKKERKRQTEVFVNDKMLTKESYLILSLLSLNDVQREQYLVKVAKERGLLQRNPLNNVIAVNPKYGGILPVIRKAAYANIEHMASCTLQLNGERKQLTGDQNEAPPNSKETKVKKLAEKQKTSKDYTYEEQIMMIVNDLEELPSDLSTLKHVIKLNKKNLNDEDRKKVVDQFVKALVDEGKGHIHSGQIRINARNYTQAFVCDKETRDVFIGTPCLRQYALQSDLVEIYVHHGVEVELPAQDLTDSNNESVENELAEAIIKPRNKLGFVTKILQKNHNRKCVGTFFKEFSKDKKTARFVPRDQKMPLISIPKLNWPNALLTEKPEDVINVVYLAEIVDWRGDKAIGKIIQSIGKSGELIVENSAILVQNNLDVTPFPDEILLQLPPSTFEIPSSEIAKRRDCRNEIVFTIDPLTARDLDDALSCRKLPNGNYQVGVHISDVSYFLEEDSELDNIVKEKATTVYMVSQVYHMLPEPLCMLCSLLPGEDKLAFSVFWEITPNAQILSTTFERTVINSCAKFAYEHAQKIIETHDEASLDEKEFPEILNDVSFKDCREIIKTLNDLALKLRAKRMAKGALKIDQPKLYFRLDPNTELPIGFQVQELKDSNRMIEDWMLLANCSVAEFIFEHFPNESILRSHPPPNDNSMDNLEGNLKKYGLELSGRNSKELRKTMEEIISKSTFPNGAKAVMNVLLSKPMQKAKYYCSGVTSSPEERKHFALAVDLYTHFTSPIRRYPDIMVHRALSACLKYTQPSKRSTAELQSLAEISNTKKWCAKTAGEECSELYFRTYLTKVGSVKTTAAIMSLGPFSIDVVLLETGHSIKIYYKHLEPDTIVKVSDESKVTHIYMWWPKIENVQAKKLTLFSELVVEVTAQKMKLSIKKVFPN